MSLTPEGRALGLAEIARLAAWPAAGSVVDLGFVPGAEAGLVSLDAVAGSGHRPSRPAP